jgi:hypothetical protein
MSSHHNAVLDLSNSIESIDILQSLFDASKGKGEGRIKCTITKHRIAKTAILLGIALLSKKPPSMALKLINQWAPTRVPVPRGMRAHKRVVRSELVLECSSTQGLLDGVDRVWRVISGAVSHRRVTKACLTIGLDSLNKVDPGKVRQLVSKVCPVPKKYFDPELQQWL